MDRSARAVIAEITQVLGTPQSYRCALAGAWAKVPEMDAGRETRWRRSDLDALADLACVGLTLASCVKICSILLQTTG